MYELTYAARRVSLAAATLLLAACSSNTSTGTSTHNATATTATDANSPTTSLTTASSPSTPLSPPANRCGPPVDAAAHPLTLHGPSGATLPGVEVGHGTTFAILLHQTDGYGFCGSWPFADWLATEHDVHALLFDLCGFGRARCPDSKFSSDQQAQVALAVKWAQAHGGRRVVLVGASMGGALALSTAAVTRVDAVVDLSGPPSWPGAEARKAVPKITVPVLMVVSPNDPYASYPESHAAFNKIPARHKRFIKGTGAHGWSLLSGYTASANRTRWLPLATTVAHWIKG